MISASLERMRNTDVRTVDRAELVDIRDVTVNTSLTHEKRLLDFLNQVKNPYCVKHGKTVVKLSYADTAATIEDRLEKYLMSL